MKRVTIRMEAPRRTRVTAGRGEAPHQGRLTWLLLAVAVLCMLLWPLKVRAGEAPADGTTAAAYVQKSALGYKFDVESSELALRKSQTPSIRDFALDMIKAHRQSSADLTDAVKSGHVKVALPTALDPQQQQLLQTLRTESGAQFERTYLQAQLQGHREALDRHRAYGQAGDNGALKQFANQATPWVQQNLANLEALTQTHFIARMCWAPAARPVSAQHAAATNPAT